MYRPASAASGSPTYMKKPIRLADNERGTPISSNKQDPNPNTMEAIGASLVALPELD